MRVLLIDDDKDDQAIFIEAVNLITDEILCETADNGVEGLERLMHSVSLPDIVFLDLNMPLMDGRETLAAIRKHPILETIPVVIFSTSNSETDIRWSRAMNAKYLVKPNDITALVRSLARVFRETLMTEEAPQITRQAC